MRPGFRPGGERKTARQADQPGALGRNCLVRGGQETPLPGKFTLNLLPGDILSIQTPGGGGWGKSSKS